VSVNATASSKPLRGSKGSNAADIPERVEGSKDLNKSSLDAMMRGVCWRSASELIWAVLQPARVKLYVGIQNHTIVDEEIHCICSSLEHRMISKSPDLASLD
jgi:hypothetical protein